MTGRPGPIFESVARKSSFGEVLECSEVVSKVHWLCREKAVQTRGTEHGGPEVSPSSRPPGMAKSQGGCIRVNKGRMVGGEAQEQVGGKIL